MTMLEIFDLYNLICRGSADFILRKESKKLRKIALNSVLNNGLIKIAFDTRRINQETEYNPRRGLQNYNRSEAFITDNMSQKIKHFSKLRKILLDLKEVYGKEHEWQDSNVRILLSTLDNGLRSIIKDGDYTNSQPGTGSFDYIEELMHVRYRLSFDDLSKKGEAELKKIILSKDEELTHKDYCVQNSEITKKDIESQSYDTLIDKLFSIKATADNPEIQRTVTITIKDSIIKKAD